MPVESAPEAGAAAIAAAGVPGDARRAPAAPLRVIVCGGPGHGKSTLIERLEGALHGATRTKTIIEEVAQETDALVASGPRAHTALIVADAREGLGTDTRRQIKLAVLLGVADIVVAVNKMDLVGYGEDRFRGLERQLDELREDHPESTVAAIPIAASSGESVTHSTGTMPWYRGPSLVAHLRTAETSRGSASLPFRMVVQRTEEVVPNRRGFVGVVSGGVIKPGDAIVVFPSRSASTVERILSSDRREAGGDGDLDIAVAGERVMLTLRDAVHAVPGDLIASGDAPPGLADQFEATIIWSGEQPMLRGRSYRLQSHGIEVAATIAPLKYKLQIDTLERVAATKLERGEIGVCELELSDPIAFDPFEQNRETGSFTLLDRVTGGAIGFGAIHFALRRSHNVQWQAVEIDKRARSESLAQKPTVLWLTGLSGSGKSTVANLVESELHERGHHTYMLDGDNVRHGLNADLGFTEADRVENIRRVSEVAQLMVDAGLIVIVSFISPFRDEREMARSLFEPGEFIEVFVDTPLAVAEERDTKGLYKKARSGKLVNFTGIDSPYEPPEAAEIHLKTIELTPEAAAAKVIELLEVQGRLRPPPTP